MFSKDDKEYESFGVFELKLQKGIQLFKMKESDIVEEVIYGEWKYNYCKVVIKETFGGNKRCYVNKYFMFDDVREDISIIEQRLNENIDKIKEKRDYEEKREQMFFNEIQKGTELVDSNEHKPLDKDKKAFCINNNELGESNRKLLKKITNLIKEPNTFIATQKRRNKNTLKNYLNDLSNEIDTTSPPPTTWNGLHNNLDNIYNSIEDMKQPIRPIEQFEYKNEYTNADEFTRDLSYILYKKDYEIYNKKNVFFIGRKIDAALSKEASLKLKEISYMHSEAYEAGELKHGTISLIEKGTPVFAIVTEDDVKEKTVSNICEVKARGAMTIVVSNEDGFDCDYLVKVPRVNEFLQAILVVPCLQLVAYEVAKLRGCDIDKPKNLAKSVTVE